MGILGNAMSGGRWVSATVLGEYERTRLYKAESSDRGKCHSPFVPSDCLLPSEPEVLGKRVRDWWMSPECSPGNVRFSSKLLPAASADDHVLLWGCSYLSPIRASAYGVSFCDLLVALLEAIAKGSESRNHDTKK